MMGCINLVPFSQTSGHQLPSEESSNTCASGGASFHLSHVDASLHPMPRSCVFLKFDQRLDHQQMYQTENIVLKCFDTCAGGGA